MKLSPSIAIQTTHIACCEHKESEVPAAATGFIVPKKALPKTADYVLMWEYFDSIGYPGLEPRRELSKKVVK